MVIVASMTLAIAHSRGWLGYEERVAHYWPEFAQRGLDRCPSAVKVRLRVGRWHRRM